MVLRSLGFRPWAMGASGGIKLQDMRSHSFRDVRLNLFDYDVGRDGGRAG